MRFSAVLALAACLTATTSLTSSGLRTADAAPDLRSPRAVAPAAGARLISESQFANTIVGMFGADFDFGAAFAPVRREKGLVAVGSSSAVITPGAFNTFENVARRTATKLIDPAYRDFLIPCQPADAKMADPACSRQFVSRVGRMLFRRSLTPQEVEAHAGIANNTATTLQDFYAGISDSLISLMVAPDFLFTRETSVPRKDGTSVLTGTSKATRLSILLWDAYPDEELLVAAESGSLDTPRGLARQVDRMLASPRVASSVRAFFTDMLQFDQFTTLSKDPTIYPAFTTKVVGDAREQSLRLIVDHLVTDNLDYRDLFTTRKTFLTDDLGSIYRVPVSRPDKWVEYEFPADSPRAGLLTQVSMLSLYSHPGRSSPTKRGRALRELLLCQQVPDPPANVDFSGFQDPKSVGKTVRDRLNAHATNPVCAGCHKITDQIGLGLENFDGAAQFRAEESGERIDTTGSLNGVKFDDAKGLGAALRNDPALPGCLVNRLSAFSLGRAMNYTDNEWTKYLQAEFAKGGYQIRPLLKRIATSEAFYTIPAAAPAPQQAKQ